MTDYPGKHVCCYLAVELYQLIGKELTSANRTFDLMLGIHGLAQVFIQQVAMVAATMGESDGLRPDSGSEGGFVLVPWFLG